MAARASDDTVWVDVLPSMRGFATSLVKSASSAGRKAGQAATKELDASTKGAGQKVADNLTEGLAQAQAEVEKVSAALATARDREADAAGKVRVAEAQLQAVRSKAKATDAQKAAAEERLATAQRGLEAAQRATAGTTARLDQAQAGAAARAKVLAEETGRSEKIMVRFAASLDRIDSSRIDNAAGSMARFGLSASKTATQVVALGSAIPTIAGIAATATQAAGAALVLPGALASAGAALGVVKLGLSGVGDALKEWDDAEKFAEAIKELSPSGQAAAIAIRNLRPELIGLRNLVQDSLLDGTNRDIEALGRTYLPLLRDSLPPIAAEFGQARAELAGFAASGRTVEDVRQILGSTRYSVDNVTGALVPLASAFRDIAVVGAAAFGDLTLGADTAAQRFADYIAALRESGQLDAILRQGFDVLQDIGQVLGNIGNIIGAVFGAAQAQGGGLLGTLNQVTGAVAGLLSSAQGQEALTAFFSAVHQVVQTLLPGVRAVGGALFETVTVLAPTLPSVAQAFAAVAVAVTPLVPDLARLAAEILPPLADLVAWLAPALPVLAAGFIAGRVALAGYNIVTTIVGWVQAWAAAQWGLNAALNANPIGLVVVAIAALVGGFIYLWNNSEGFRDFWIGLWESIRDAAIWVYDNALKPAFDGIVTALRWVGEAATWLWQNAFMPAWEAIAAAVSWAWNSVIKPVLDFLSVAFRVVAAVLLTVLITPAVIAFKAMAAVVTWLWTEVLKPVFDAVGVLFSWLWQNIISPAIDAIVLHFRVLGAAASLLWTQYIQPALSAIGDFFSWLWRTIISPIVGFIVETIRQWGVILTWLWQNIVTPVFHAISTAVSAVGDAFKWAWENLIKPAWDALGTAISWVWETVIKPVFDAVKTVLSTVGDAFRNVVDAIKTAWDRVYDILSKPIKWVIDVVYNEGIRAVWNKIAGIVGLGELSPISFGGSGSGGGGAAQAMAHGGVLPGYAPGVDSIPVMASPGEGWLVPEAVRGLGANFVGWANRHFSGGRSSGGVNTGNGAGFGGVQGFADGGIVGKLLGWVPGIGDDITALWTDPIGYVKAKFGGLGEWTTAIAKAPAQMIASGASWLWGKLKSFSGFSSDEAASAAGGAGGTPMGWQQMWEIIRAQFPTATLNSAYRAGDPGYHGKGRAIDIGGPMDAVNAWIAKVYPNSTQLIYTPGTNLLNGAPFTYNSDTQADHFDHVHWAFDSGGYLPTGVSTVYNGTGRPEPVLTGRQWDTLASGQGGEFHLTSGRLQIDGDGLVRIIDGRVVAAGNATGSALSRRPRL